jgi:hypothetical protein
MKTLRAHSFMFDLSGDYLGTKIGSRLEVKMRLKGGLSAV